MNKRQRKKYYNKWCKKKFLNARKAVLYDLIYSLYNNQIIKYGGAAVKIQVDYNNNLKYIKYINFIICEHGISNTQDVKKINKIYKHSLKYFFK